MAVKICIVGCGALGGVIAAHLARLEDVEIYAYDITEEHVRGMKERGLRISGAAEFTVKLNATSREMSAEGARAPGKRNVSMLLDVLAKRQTEVDFVNGAIADQGEKLGVPVPLNRAMWQLVKGLEQSWRDPA
jgi:ketopantoate reductase